MSDEKVTPGVTPANNAILMMLYLLYKTNILTRRHVKSILKIIQQEWPKDLAAYLQEEAAKAV